MNSQLSFIDEYELDDDDTKRRRPVEPILRSAVIDDMGLYRYLLKRAWGAGPCVMWCGLNPSTADAERDDPTMWREIEFSYRWGFGSLIKVNIYPFRSASVDALKEWRETWTGPKNEWPFADGAFNKNIQFVRDHISQCALHIAAWGANPIEDDLDIFLRRACRVVDDDEFGSIDVPVEWSCIGKNENGSPRHTLSRGAYRVPNNAKPMPWQRQQLASRGSIGGRSLPPR